MPAAVAVPAELNSLQEAIDRAMSRVEHAFERQLRSDLPPLERLVQHVESYRGKMLRPRLVMLSGLAAGNRSSDFDAAITEPHVVIAAVCEMIHMATLVHDDVLDEADVRRKGATVNRLRGNEAAVILGDYLFSSAYHLCSTLDSQQAALLIGATGMTLCAGELLQLHHRRNFSIDQATYFEVVRRKTASLIATACKLGAAGSTSDLALHDRFHAFGENLGIAFQIQDDLLDLVGNQAVVGKPLRRDVELGKLTLPLIHHLGAATNHERGRTLLLLDDADHVEPDHARQLVEALQATGSLEHAKLTAATLVERGKNELDSLPDSPPKRMLLHLADQVVNRAF